MAFSAKQLLTLDWNRRDLRMMVVRPRSDGVDLIKAVAVPIPPEVRVEEPAAFGPFIQEAMREAKIGVKRAILSVPRDQVVLNTLNLPPMPPEEMPAIVQFQVVKELPFSADQATLDFAVCGVYEPKAPSSVLVAAVRNEDLNYYTKVCSEAGLHVLSIGLRPYSNLVAILSNAPDLAAKNVLLVEVGPQLTEIDIIKKGVLSFSRSASVSLTDIAAEAGEAYKDSRIAGPAVKEREPDDVSAKVVSAMMVEIIRSYEAYRATDPTISLDQIVVCGSSGIEPQLAQALAARFATMAELFAPDRALGLTAQRARELRGFSAAVGLSMGHSRKGLDHIDFLHPKKPVSKKQLRMRKVPVAVATAVLFIGSAVMFHLRFIAPRQAVVEVLRDEIVAKMREERKIVEFKNKVDALEGWIESEQYWPLLIVGLTEVFPDQKEAYLTRLDFETRPKGRSAGRESVARLKFRTVTMGTVNDMANKFREAGFANVVTGRETASGTRDAYARDTGIDLDIPDRSILLAARASRLSHEAETNTLPVEQDAPPAEAVEPNSEPADERPLPDSPVQEKSEPARVRAPETASPVKAAADSKHQETAIPVAPAREQTATTKVNRARPGGTQRPGQSSGRKGAGR